MNFAPRCILHRCPNQFIHRYTWTEEAIAIWLQAQLSAYVLNVKGPCVIYVNNIRANTDYVDSDYKSGAFLTYWHTYIIMRMFEYSWAKTLHARHNCNILLQVMKLYATQIILPQVHLRKPCYDFSFL